MMLAFIVPERMDVYYTAPRELELCEAFCVLGPNEVQDVEFILPPAAPLIRTEITAKN